MMPSPRQLDPPDTPLELQAKLAVAEAAHQENLRNPAYLALWDKYGDICDRFARECEAREKAEAERDRLEAEVIRLRAERDEARRKAERWTRLRS